MFIWITRAELVLRTHLARVIADNYGPYGKYLEEGFYLDAEGYKPTLDYCLRDLERRKERHILRYRSDDANGPTFDELPVWSAVEAFSFGTLSRCIERGDKGKISPLIATSMGIAKAGFASRVRALVYLRNLCAHHIRLWNHSVLDAGATPNNLRRRAKKQAGQFEPRSILDVVTSLENFLDSAESTNQVLSSLITQYKSNDLFWGGLTHPKPPIDNRT